MNLINETPIFPLSVNREGLEVSTKKQSPEPMNIFLSTIN